MTDANFRLQKSFGIDSGELDGLSPQQCFVLGYELAQIDGLLMDGRNFARPVHAANKDRIEKACRDSGREFDLSWMDDDGSETWMWLKVKKS